MKKSKIIFIVFFCSTFLIFLNNTISNSYANPLWVLPTEVGGFIPNDNHSCSMPNASVLFEIDASIFYKYFDLEFSGNYTLYNPSDTLNLTIAAPFSRSVLEYNTSCIIEINGSIIPYEIIRYRWDETYSWDEYISIYDRNLIICNITIPTNSTIILEFEFNTYIEPLSTNADVMDFYYDLGTAAAWNGSISERVEFRVHGRQPDSISTWHNYNIIDISDGKSYLWEWQNVEIPKDMYPIIISYNIRNNYIGGDFLVLFLLGIISLGVLLRRVKSIVKK